MSEWYVHATVFSFYWVSHPPRDFISASNQATYLRTFTVTARYFSILHRFISSRFYLGNIAASADERCLPLHLKVLWEMFSEPAQEESVMFLVQQWHQQPSCNLSLTIEQRGHMQMIAVHSCAHWPTPIEIKIISCSSFRASLTQFISLYHRFIHKRVDPLIELTPFLFISNIIWRHLALISPAKPPKGSMSARLFIFNYYHLGSKRHPRKKWAQPGLYLFLFLPYLV